MKYSHKLTENFQLTKIGTRKEREIGSTYYIRYIDIIKSVYRPKNIIQPIGTKNSVYTCTSRHVNIPVHKHET